MLGDSAMINQTRLPFSHVTRKLGGWVTRQGVARLSTAVLLGRILR